MRRRPQESVTAEEISSAIRGVQADEAAGVISPRVAVWRIDRCRRASTPRQLWKASGGHAGAPGRNPNPREREGVLANLVDGLLTFPWWR